MPKKKKILRRKPRKISRKKISAKPREQTNLPLKQMPLKRQQRFQHARGMHDILPEEWHYYDFIFRTAESVLRSYDFERLEPPLVEDVNLFARAIGESTDIVSKEMFLIKDREMAVFQLRRIRRELARRAHQALAKVLTMK